MNCVIGFLIIVYGLGLAYILKYGFKNCISPKTHFVLINAKNTKSIEYTIRNAIKTYPGYDIYIINSTDNDEMKKILECFRKDYPGIKIIPH